MQKRRRELEGAAEEIEQLFADLWQVFPFSRGMRRGYRPEVDVYRTGDPGELTVVVELPGVDPANVQVVASQRALLIAGERNRPKDSGHYQQMEIDYGRFTRQVALSVDIDVDSTKATYKRGMLTIVLPLAKKPVEAERVEIPTRSGR